MATVKIPVSLRLAQALAAIFVLVGVFLVLVGDPSAGAPAVILGSLAGYGIQLRVFALERDAQQGSPAAQQDS